ncbi:MAG TPA: DNA-processing protein DprA [Candidatus Pacearchaeota archaeon]|nr:DNA-processing protein DprA [Candidatus Parcubacteria bacterium]HNZ83886.1 DNA-processing protein DprA [Candidatus Pacearchaeota archaeon]HOU45554.1 DNA-processing protein DprA [Candidatus Pacearchaeota archaeon]HPM08417.1 DNA-processing protein DprA [Candidatus Pacearchaeota archaeon]HQI74289.1 DNA-processing protein DprA [Candidatus Pacearchaeota archaeon]
MDEIREIKITDKNYPKRLKEIKDAPDVLYIRGKIPLADHYLGIVGTRQYTIYGKQVALDISSDIAKSGIIIISGMAQGIDTFAHMAAIENNTPTIAVLGTGLDEKSIYPQSNIKLSRRIIEKGGCLISEYPPGTHGNKATFPKRNRIIAALSEGIVVIEAKDKSGSLITADWAKKMEKPIFAIPGSIYSQFSDGCHKLIKQGAIFTTSYQDILKKIGITNKKSKKDIFSINLTNKEKMVLKAILDNNCDIDSIARKTKLSIQDVCISISNLEINKKIKNLGGNIFTIFK